MEVGFALLRALCSSPDALMLRDLSQAAGMSAAKAHRYLVSFQRLGLVVQDGDTARYALGPAALQLGLSALARLDGVKLARQAMAQFQAAHGLTVAVAVWGNHGPTMVHWSEAAQAVTVNLRLGDVMPLLGSATGRCFCAFLPRSATAALLAEALAESSNSGRTDLPLTETEVATLFEAVRQDGLARVVDTLVPGIAGFAAPVFDADGHVVLAVVALGSVARVRAANADVLAQALRSTASELSQTLGA